MLLYFVSSLSFFFLTPRVHLFFFLSCIVVPISLQPGKEFLVVYFFSGKISENTSHSAGELVLIFD